MIRRLFTRVRRSLARRLGRARLLKTVGQLREGGDRAELARALRNLGELERRLFPGAAREHYEQAVAIFREVGDPLKLAHTVRHLGDVHHEAGRGELAEPCYREALALYRNHEPRQPLNLANAIRSLAVLEGETGLRADLSGRRAQNRRRKGDSHASFGNHGACFSIAAITLG